MHLLLVFVLFSAVHGTVEEMYHALGTHKMEELRDVLPLNEDLILDVASYMDLSTILNLQLSRIRADDDISWQFIHGFRPRRIFGMEFLHCWMNQEGMTIPGERLIPIQNAEGFLDLEYIQPHKGIWKKAITELKMTSNDIDNCVPKNLYSI